MVQKDGKFIAVLITLGIPLSSLVLERVFWLTMFSAGTDIGGIIFFEKFIVIIVYPPGFTFFHQNIASCDEDTEDNEGDDGECACYCALI